LYPAGPWKTQGAWHGWPVQRTSGELERVLRDPSVNARAMAASRPTILFAVISALALSLLWVMSPVLATHVEPIPVNEGNPTCDDFAPEGESWTQFKLE